MQKRGETGKFVKISDRPLRNFTIRLHPDEVEKLETIAKELNIPKSDVLRQGLAMVFSEHYKIGGEIS